MEFFLQRKNALDLSTLFPSLPVEKPVENVDNSQIRSVNLTLQMLLCQLIIEIAGILREDICFLYEYSENNPVFVKNIEKSPLLLGKLMVSSKGWRENQLLTGP